MAEDKKISELDDNINIDGSENIVVEKSLGNFKNTLLQVKNYVLNGLNIGVETVKGDGVDNADPSNPVISYPTPNDIGAVESIVAGSNINVDSTDANNPIVSTIPATSAGVLSTTYLTGDVENVNGTDYYKSNRENEGTVASVQTTVVANNSTVFFTQDIIGDPYPIETKIPKGHYSGNISVGASNSGFDKFRNDIEIYLCDNDGTPINSGITDEPIGDLGVQIITNAHTSEYSVGVTVTEIIEAITSVLAEDLIIPLGYRIRYHISATKIGGGNSICSLYLGYDHINYVDIPTPVLASGVINDDPSIAGNTQGDLNTSFNNSIVSLENEKVAIATNPSKTEKGAIKAFYDATTSTLEISIDGTDIV